MKNFITTIQTRNITITEAYEAFGERVVNRAYDAGRITFEGEFVVFVQ